MNYIVRIILNQVSHQFINNQYQLILGNRKYEILSSKDGFTFLSTLIIRDTSYEDFGYYGCAIINSLGSDELSIHLEMNGQYKYLKMMFNKLFSDEFPMLLILIGIFVTIIMILLITLGFLLCRKNMTNLCHWGEEQSCKQDILKG